MPGIIDTLRYVLTLDDSGFKGKAVEADAAVNKLAGSMSGVLTGALGALATGFTAVRIGDFLRDATMTAARTEVLGTVLHQVGKTAGMTSGDLDNLVDRIKSLGITTQDARQAVIRFMQVQLDLNDSVKLARIAQDLAVIGNQNSSDALAGLTLAVAKTDVELLRQYGIVINAERLFKQYATTINKAASELSDIERRQAILNEVFRQGARAAGTYEAAMGDVGKQLTSLPRYFEEFKDALGNKFLPVLQQVVDLTKDFLEGWTEVLSSTAESQNKWATKLIVTGEGLIKNLTDQYAAWEQLREEHEATRYNMVMLHGASEGLKTVQEQIAKTFPGLIQGYTDEGIAIGLTQEAVDKYVASKQREIGNVSKVTRQTYIAELENEKRKLDELKKSQEKLGRFTDFRLNLFGYKMGAPTIDFEAEIKKSEDYIKRLETLLEGLPDSAKKAKDKTRAALSQLGDESLLLDAIVPGDLGAKVGVGLQAALNSAEVESAFQILKNRFAGISIDFGSTIQSLKDAINSGAYEGDTQKQLIDALVKAKQLDAERRADEQKFWDDELAHEADLHGQTVRDIEEEKYLRIQAALDISDSLSYAASNFFSLFDEGIARIASNLGNAISGAISGFSQGGIAGIASGFGAVVSGFVSIFSDSSDEMVRSLTEVAREEERLREATIDLKESFNNYTQAQLEKGQKALERADVILDNPNQYKWTDDQVRGMLISAGIAVSDNLSGQALRDFVHESLAEIKSLSGDFGKFMDAKTANERKQRLGEAKTFDEAKFLANTWTDLFDLSLEEQQELWQGIWDRWSTSGQLTKDDIAFLGIKLDDIKDSVNSSKGSGSEQTQVSRSIQKITERQADSLISAAMTIDLHLQEGFQAMVTAIKSLTGGFTMNAAATLEVAIINANVMNVGYMNVSRSNMSGGNQSSKQLVEVLGVESRASGNRAVR